MEAEAAEAVGHVLVVATTTAADMRVLLRPAKTFPCQQGWSRNQLFSEMEVITMHWALLLTLLPFAEAELW